MEKQYDYILKNIPPKIWERVRIVAVKEHITYKELILRGMNVYCDMYDDFEKATNELEKG